MADVSAIEAFDEFVALGVFQHVDDATLKQARQSLEDLLRTNPTYILDVLDAVPDVIWRRGDFNMLNAMQKQRLQALVHPNNPQLNAYFETYEIRLMDTEHGNYRISEHIETLNRYLVDNDMPYRFYYLQYQDDAGLHGPMQNWAIIYLSDDQRYAPQMINLLSFDINQRYTWSLKRIEHTLKRLEKVGILSNDADKEALIPEITSIGYERMSSVRIFNHIEGATWAFDAELIYEPAEDYYKLMQWLIDLSKGGFAPDTWTVSYDEESRYVTILFKLMGRDFEIKFTYESDWVDFTLITQINQALKEVDSDSTFYNLVTGDQVAVMMFLTQIQYQALTNEGLAEFETFD